MCKSNYFVVCTFLYAIFTVSPVLADHPEILSDVTVSGEVDTGFNPTHIEVDAIRSGISDTSALMSKVPGGSFNDNGPLSGQTQYRGMFGTRMNVRVDGMYLNSGGPNWMDPPLHYLPSTLLDSMEVSRGIAPVSSGTGIGGYVKANTKTSKFTSNDEFEFHGDIEASVHSVDDGYNLGGLLGYSNDTHRFHLLGARDEASDIDFGEGEINGTKHERDNYGLGYGYRRGQHELALNFRHQDTGRSGNPSLPLDIVFLDTELFNAKYNTQWNNVKIETSINYTDVGHQMDNFTLRPAPDFFTPGGTTDRRLVNATSDSIVYSLKGSLPLARGNLSVGFDTSFNQHDSTVLDPDQASFFVTNFNNVQNDSYSFFAETTQQLTQRTGIELGVRYTRVEMDADDVSAIVTPAGTAGPTAALSTAFNTSDRSQEDNNVDWVAELNFEANDHLTVELGLARKTRSPYYVERYMWIPLEVNAGLGDSNGYIGDVNLDPEVSHQIELGLDWHHHHYYVAPRVYYRSVDDYIQGTASTNAAAITVATLNSETTPLVFTNVDAEFYGADANWGYSFNERWHLDGVISYVRGKRRDIDDNLYRIAPLNSTIALTHERSSWSATVEGVFVAEQHDISDTIVTSESRSNNDSTPGYILMNISGKWKPTYDITINAGVSNLLDKNYTNHLSGFNRNSGGAVPVGSRLPGQGRNVFATLSYEW
ncbi:MAG: TonB-dependent receptor [Proteobacteria bacterium]|nr:TonB-dependent receptor [Pseudomonadota bacterium]NOG59303.1 TonB-dependent receptor [Pseudomonadota bacterium]